MIKGLRLDNGTLRDIISKETGYTKYDTIVIMNTVEDFIRLREIYKDNKNYYKDSYFNSAAVNIIKTYREQENIK